jgi:uncharacterized beta-barrel protein YwiB (DUF1934 family)
MTKEILITIEGQQLGNDEEPIIVTSPGIYHFTNGRHYVQYQEILTDSGVISKNTLKISPSHILLSKRTNHISQMEFDLNEITQTIYQTAYGDLNFDIRTDSIVISEEAERIEVSMNYSLSTNDAHVSDNRIRITIEAVL